MTNQYFHEFAERLLDNGFYPIPIVEKQKRPAVSRWTQFDKIDDEQYQKLIKDHTQHGIGILLGKVCVIDVDIMNKDLSFEIIKLINEGYVFEIPNTPAWITFVSLIKSSIINILNKTLFIFFF